VKGILSYESQKLHPKNAKNLKGNRNGSKKVFLNQDAKAERGKATTGTGIEELTVTRAAKSNNSQKQILVRRMWETEVEESSNVLH
jgi:hypothetical protein